MVHSAERSEEETKLGIFIEDFKQIGNFNEISNTPEGMFPDVEIFIY